MTVRRSRITMLIRSGTLPEGSTSRRLPEQFALLIVRSVCDWLETEIRSNPDQRGVPGLLSGIGGGGFFVLGGGGGGGSRRAGMPDRVVAGAGVLCTHIDDTDLS